jgi:enamine deaminase RidA (YjgF/YER057c/UK114 family)
MLLRPEVYPREGARPKQLFYDPNPAGRITLRDRMRTAKVPPSSKKEKRPMKSHNPPSMAAANGYSYGVEIPPNARVLFCAGQIGADADGKIAPDARSQSEQAWKNVGIVLAAAGMGFEDIVRVNNYVVGTENLPAYREVRTKILGKNAPASTLVVVAGLAQPNILVEVEVVAAKE